MAIKFNPFTGKLDVVDDQTGDFSSVELDLGTAIAPSISFNGDPNTGIYSPGANEVAISTSGSGRLFVDSSGNVGVNVSAGAVSSNELLLVGNKAIRWQHATDGTQYGDIYTDTSSNIVFRNGASSTERLRITSDGKLGLGTSTPSSALDVAGAISLGAVALPSAGTARIFSRNTDSNLYIQTGSGNTLNLLDDSQNTMASFGASTVTLQTGNSPRLTIDSSGNVGIGTASPDQLLHLSSAGFPTIRVTDADNSTYFDIANSDGDIILKADEGNTFADSAIRFNIDSSEKFRCDSSGRLLVGTSTAPTGSNTQYTKLGAFGNSSNNTASFLSVSYGSPATSLSAGIGIGRIFFGDTAAAEFASISAETDGSTGASDYPGRLVFATTADGASSPTERIRITSDGILTNKTAGIGSVSSFQGFSLGPRSDGYAIFSRDAANPVFINRFTDDGGLVGFYQNGTAEGDISVSGSTVSYNGAHLSRWSQLAGGAERIEILRGSVLSNLDEMCEWTYEAKEAIYYTEEDELPEGVSVGDIKELGREAGTENNEQLNRMKISDVEGDPNVAGIFQGWDNEDETYTNDFYCAMTGDFIIRIAEGVTVQRGDLLMSAGDGTAKPQDDDIIRSKTIAKVTSTHVTCTYDDGSYCVPCVLMAC